jgi:hypothetical protein
MRSRRPNRGITHREHRPKELFKPPLAAKNIPAPPEPTPAAKAAKKKAQYTYCEGLRNGFIQGF